MVKGRRMKDQLRTMSMTPEERSCLESLDAAVRSQEVREQVRPITERVRAELAANQKALMAWERIPLNVFGRALPQAIRSAWVFILRTGAETGAERHPNSHQRMMSFEESGDMKTGEPADWQPNILVSDSEALLEHRWISIPPNTWHCPVVGAGADWAVVSFHTVTAQELIEEKPDDSRKGGTKQMRYMSEGRTEK